MAGTPQNKSGLRFIRRKKIYIVITFGTDYNKIDEKPTKVLREFFLRNDCNSKIHKSVWVAHREYTLTR